MIGTFIKTSSTTYLLGFAILLASHGYVYFTGREHGLEKYYAFKADVESAQEQIRIDNEAKLKAMANVAGHAAEGWNAALRELDRIGRVVRVQPRRCEGILPTDPTAPPGIDATAETRTISAEQCEAYLTDGIHDAAQLLHLQKFLIDQHEASKR